jgi:3-dehydroquinate synthase class II
MLSRAPTIQLADLKKGDAVMIVATDGTTDVTAITLVAGVEPLLEAPAASQSLLNNWSMGGGSGAAEAAAQ